MMKNFSQYLQIREDAEANRPEDDKKQAALHRLAHIIWDRHRGETKDFLEKLSQRDPDIRKELEQLDPDAVPMDGGHERYRDRDDIVVPVADRSSGSEEGGSGS